MKRKHVYTIPLREVLEEAFALPVQEVRVTLVRKCDGTFGCEIQSGDNLCESEANDATAAVMLAIDRIVMVRIPKHIEQEIRHELDLRPEKHGSAYLREYDKAVKAWDQNMSGEQNFNQRLMANVENAGQRLKAWYDRILRARTEFVERKRDDA